MSGADHRYLNSPANTRGGRRWPLNSVLTQLSCTNAEWVTGPAIVVDAASKYSAEFKERAVRLVLEQREEYPCEFAAIRSVAAKLGMSVVVLTGDNVRTAAAIAAQAGISEVRAELSPEDKASIVTEPQARGPVEMVGDGIEAAPALAPADAGIPMGAMDSDVAIEAAAVALVGEDLRRLPDAIISVAQQARAIFTQNLVLSGLIIAVLVPLSAFGILGLTAVVATAELAEVFVILNGIPAGRRRLSPTRPGLSGPRASRVVEKISPAAAQPVTINAPTAPTLTPAPAEPTAQNTVMAVAASRVAPAAAEPQPGRPCPSMSTR